MAGYKLFCSWLMVHLAASMPPTTPSAGCRHPLSNEIIPANSFPIVVDDMVCHCIVSMEATPGDDYPLADCHFHGPELTTGSTPPQTTLTTYPRPTTPPRPQCTNSDGHTYYIGETYNPDSCAHCECTYYGEECYRPTCPPPACVNLEFDGCCPFCPNGPDCLDTRDFTWIPTGTSITKASGEVCQCPLPAPSEIVPYAPRTPICTMTTPSA